MVNIAFYDFCGARSVVVNSVYKLQFFYIYQVSDYVDYVAVRAIINSNQWRKATYGHKDFGALELIKFKFGVTR